MKRLADFDLSAAPMVNPATIATLANGSYLAAPATRSSCSATAAQGRATC